MRKQILMFFAVLLMAVAMPKNAAAYDFSYTYQGKTLYFNIVNGEAQVTDDGSYSVYNASGNDYIVGDVVIPSTVTYNNVEYTVTSIASSAFYGCSYITSMVLPNTLKTIGSQSFYGCRIANIVVPDGVTSIGNWAFVSIRHIEYHGSASYNSYYRYWNAGSMNGYTEGDFVYSSDSKTSLWAYLGNDASVTIPSTVTSIGRYAFEYCSNLTSVTLHDGITSIGDRAFLCCENLLTVNIPGSVHSIGNGAFAFSGITSATINDGVEYIGEYAFEQCDRLTSINIPNSVTSLGQYAFYQDTLLATVTIGTGLTSLASSTFNYCLNLSSIEINSPITSIESAAFSTCSSLTEFEIPSTVTTIGTSAFYYCTGMVSMTIPSTVNSIGNNAFERIRHIEYHGEATGAPWGALSMNGVVDGGFVFSDVTKTVLVGYVGSGGDVVIPSTVNTIVPKTFAYCETITSVTIPSTVLYIGDSAFYCCYNILSANIPEHVTEISKATFYGCHSLDSVYIGESVASIGDYAFYLCTHLSSINAKPTTPPSVGSYSFSSVPSSVKILVPCGSSNSYSNSSRWRNSFYNFQETDGTDGRSAVSPSGHTLYYNIVNGEAQVIHSDAYLSYTDDLIVPDSVTLNCVKYAVTSIGNSAFYGCSGLTSVTIPNSVISIGLWAFRNCSGLTSVTIGSSVISIGNLAFSGCGGLTTITIPNSVTSIGENAFYGCGGLTSVTIGNSVTSIGNQVFYNCSNLTSIIIPNSVTSIGNYVFCGCSSLASVTIGNSLTSIGERVFSGCVALTSIEISSDNTILDSRENGNAIIESTSNTLLFGCNNTTIPNSVVSIADWAFDGCSGLTSVTIPNSVTTIGIRAFSACSGLTSVIIGNNVTDIGAYAFANCSSLASVTIGSSVTSIGNFAFEWCTHITEITCLATTAPTLGSDVFLNVIRNTPIYVPCGTVAAYQAADGWSDFTNIQETSGCTFTVTVVANNDAYGTVTGSGTYATGETVTITATPNCGYWFTHWQDSWGNTLGYSPTYTFTINSNVERTAMFEEYPLTSNIYDVCSTGQTLLYDIHCPEGTATLTGYTGTCTGDLVIPDHINVGGRNYTVDSIATGAFSSNWNPEATVTSVVIPNSVTYIGAAFFNMPLTSVHIGNGVTEIESGAFDFCEHITSIVIDPANTYYDSRNNCNAIIKTSTNEIIRGCNTTTFPSTVTSIGDNAFSNCSVNFSAIPESITLIRRGAFMNCVFPSSTLIVECGGDIMEEAFFYANGFSSVSIGAAVRGIDGSAFAGCDLATITVNSANTTYDSRNNCNAVIHTTSNVLIMGCKNTIIPEEVTEIGYSAFRQQHNLTSIVIPDNVTTIHAEAFYYDGRLQSITLGRGLSLIEGYSFINCDALRSITLLSETPPTLDGYVFHTGNPSEYDFRPNCTLFVPCGRVATYQASAGWSDFTSIQEVPGCSFTVTVSANDASYGTVTGSGSYAIGETATLTATSNIGYAFVQWNDGNTDNPRQVVVTSDTMLVAMFEARTHYVQLIYSQGMTVRTIEGSTTVPHGGSVTLEAVTDDCHHFTRWDDNSTNPVRRIENVVSDTTVVAYGESYRYTVNATGSTGGTVTSDYDSQVNCGTTVTLTATADGGYTFVRWSDNNTDNPRQITVTDNITLTAIFAATRFNVTVTANNSSWGSVTGSGEYNDGATATLTATANNGYSFVRWDDGNTDNPRSIVVVSDTVLTALFTHPGTTYNIRTCNGQTLLFAVENINHTATVIGYVGLCAGNLIVPAWFSVDDERYTVTAIGPRAFENCTGLVSVTLPITITLVDEEAFKGCTGLIEVDMK